MNTVIIVVLVLALVVLAYSAVVMFTLVSGVVKFMENVADALSVFSSNKQ